MNLKKNFELIGEKQWKCLSCGAVVHSKVDITTIPCFQCMQFPGTRLIDPRENQTKETKGPGIIRSAFNFAKAVASHVATGMQHRTKEEVELILTTHCYHCELYSTAQERCMHKDCGCPISSGKKFFNKLAWKSQHCPINKW